MDLSVIVTAHDETIVSGPTMQAADVAIDAAEAAGFSVERIIALDNATPETAAYFGQPAFDRWERRVMTCGDLGRVRNALVPDVAGDAIAFLDADDLFSANWLANGMARLRAAEAAGQRVIVHPELNWLFDGAQSVFWKPEQDDPLFLPEYFYFMNYYDSLCLVPRAAHLEVPYVIRDIPRGLSFQDWQFSIETMAAGWTHVTAPDTIIFKRRRDESLVTESRARKALVRPLPQMRMDRIGALGAGGRAGQPASPATGGATAPAPSARAAGGGAAQPRGRQGGLRPVLPPVLEPVLGDGVGNVLRRILGRNPAAGSPARRTPGGRRLPARFASDPDRHLAAGPHYGAAFAARVALAAARKGKDKRGRDASATDAYKAIDRAFDTAFYLADNPDLMRAPKVDPVAHYLRAGAREGRDPSPLFKTRLYRARHPEAAQAGENPFAYYLTKGRAAGHVAPPVPGFDTIADALGMTPQQAEAAYGARYLDLRDRLETGDLGRQVTLAEEIEPLVGLGWPEALKLKIPPFHTPMVASRLAVFLDMLAAAERTPARFVICVNRARFGGAARFEGQVARALAAGCAPGEIVVVVTDRAGLLPPERLPEGVRQIDFAALAEPLREPQRERVLAEFIRALAPEMVFNANSRLLWQTLSTYGDALAAGTKITAALFCAEQSIYGHWTGYPLKRLYRHFHQLHAVVTDSRALADELRRRYALPEDLAARLVTLEAPVNPDLPLVARAAAVDGRPQVFWSGRFDRQKRIDLVLEIAALMPEADFHLWGEAVMDSQPPEPASPNVTLHPPYARFADLPIGEADLWLYTSAWDGVPQTLLEVGVSGLPLVASDVGGTAEAALPDLATLMPQSATPRDWVAAIRAVLADPGAARARAETLRERLRGTRTRAAYAEALWALIGTAQDGPSRETPHPAPGAAGTLASGATGAPGATGAAAARPDPATAPAQAADPAPDAAGGPAQAVSGGRPVDV